MNTNTNQNLAVLNREQLDLKESIPCKICLLPNKLLEFTSENKIYTIINTGHSKNFCRCNSFVHSECLVNWCIMKYSLQCPDCNMFFNLDIERFLNENYDSYIHYFTIFFYLLMIIICLVLSIFFFLNNSFFSSDNTHWSYFLGFFFLVFFAVLIFYGLKNRKIFSAEKEYIFHIKLIPEHNTFEKIDLISERFNFLLERLFRTNSFGIFNSKIDENIFQKIENKKKNTIYNVTKNMRNNPFSRLQSLSNSEMDKKKKKIKKESSLNLFDPRLKSNIRSSNNIVSQKKKEHPNKLWLNAEELQTDSNKRFTSNILISKVNIGTQNASNISKNDDEPVITENKICEENSIIENNSEDGIEFDDNNVVEFNNNLIGKEIADKISIINLNAKNGAGSRKATLEIGRVSQQSNEIKGESRFINHSISKIDKCQFNEIFEGEMDNKVVMEVMRIDN